jgi:hypothetical protein
MILFCGCCCVCDMRTTAIAHKNSAAHSLRSAGYNVFFGLAQHIYSLSLSLTPSLSLSLSLSTHLSLSLSLSCPYIQHGPGACVAIYCGQRERWVPRQTVSFDDISSSLSSHSSLYYRTLSSPFYSALLILPSPLHLSSRLLPLF